MDKNTLFEELKKHIATGDTRAAIDFLRREITGRENQTTLAIIEADFSNLQQADMKGLLTPSESALRLNQINDRLLRLLDAPPSPTSVPSKLKMWLLLLPLVLLTGLTWYYFFQKTVQEPPINCPAFPPEIKNSVLIVPFENAGNATAKPELLLSDRINELAAKNALATFSKIISPGQDFPRGIEGAHHLAQNCAADLVVWGTYSSKEDSLRLVLHYYFKNTPEKNSLGEPFAFRDVTGIQGGTMLKTLDDAVFSLCGLIAARADKPELAKKWMNKVKQKEAVDQKLLEKLNANGIL